MPLAQRLAVNELRGDEVQAIYLPDLVDGEEVRMAQRRGGALLGCMFQGGLE